jgi:glycosyltransferase involved in cell wall biosynthesis
VTEPLVSVIVPAFNGGALLEETLASVFRQTWRRREVIVVDDGSTDDTAARLTKYGTALTVLRQANRGPGAARNTGIRAAAGDYFALLDHDDLWAPEKLERQVEVARRNPASGLIACDGEQFDGDRVLLGQLLFGPLRERLAASGERELTSTRWTDMFPGCPIATPGQTLLPRAVVERVGPFRERRDEAVDYDYWIRIARVFPVTFHLDPHMRWRYTAASASGPSALRMLRWGLMTVPVLRRHLESAPPEDRPTLKAALAGYAGLARTAVLYGRHGGMGSARWALRRLMRAAPGAPGPFLWWLATFVPAPLRRRWTGPDVTLDGRVWAVSR